MKTSFLHLPREIRDIIYSHVLESWTGYVLFHVANHPQEQAGIFQIAPCQPYYQGDDVLYDDTNYQILTSCEDQISIAIMQTCRQIHMEASEWFWQRQTFCFSVMKNYLNMTARGYTMNAKMQRVMIDCGRILPRDNHDTTKPYSHMMKGIQEVAMHARADSLKEITLRLSADSVQKLFLEKRDGHLSDFNHGMRIVEDLSTFLNWAREQLQDIVGLKRRLLIEGPSLDSNWHLMSNRPKSLDLMNEIAKELNEAFGDALIITRGKFDGDEDEMDRTEELLWENGKKLRDVWVGRELIDTDVASQFSQYCWFPMVTEHD